MKHLYPHGFISTLENKQLIQETSGGITQEAEAYKRNALNTNKNVIKEYHACCNDTAILVDFGAL